MILDDWIHRARLPQIQSRARQFLVTFAGCDYPLRIPPDRAGAVWLGALNHLNPLRETTGAGSSPSFSCTDLAQDYCAVFNSNWSDGEKRCIQVCTTIGSALYPGHRNGHRNGRRNT